MHTTSISLLEKLREPKDAAAWGRFVDLYTPLLFYWARKSGLQPADAADLVQDVFELLLQKLPQFKYDQSHSFRSWLRAVALNKWREKLRRKAEKAVGGSFPGEWKPVAASEAEAFWEADYRQQLAARALDLMKEEFEEATWRACWESVINERPAAAIAQELGLTANAVYLARSRVLRRLREELAELWD